MSTYLRVGIVATVLALAGCSAKAVTPVIEPSADETPAEKKDGDPPAKAGEVGPAFVLPADAGGRLLGTVLPPRPPAFDAGKTRSTPATAPTPRGVALPTVAPAADSTPVRLPAKARPDAAKPGDVADEVITDGFEPPSRPSAVSFSPPPREKALAEDPAIPPTPAVVATPVPDRVSTDDPSQAASAAAVVRAVPPSRDVVTPYARVSNPEPYENRVPLSVDVPGEEAVPPSVPSAKRK